MFTAYRPQQDQIIILKAMELAVQGHLIQCQDGSCGQALAIYFFY